MLNPQDLVGQKAMEIWEKVASAPPINWNPTQTSNGGSNFSITTPNGNSSTTGQVDVRFNVVIYNTGTGILDSNGYYKCLKKDQWFGPGPYEVPCPFRLDVTGTDFVFTEGDTVWAEAYSTVTGSPTAADDGYLLLKPLTSSIGMNFAWVKMTSTKPSFSGSTNVAGTGTTVVWSGTAWTTGVNCKIRTPNGFVLKTNFIYLGQQVAVNTGSGSEPVYEVVTEASTMLYIQSGPDGSGWYTCAPGDWAFPGQTTQSADNYPGYKVRTVNPTILPTSNICNGVLIGIDTGDGKICFHTDTWGYVDGGTANIQGVVKQSDQHFGSGEKTMGKVLTGNVRFSSAAPLGSSYAVFSQSAENNGGTTRTYTLQSYYDNSTEGVIVKAITDPSLSLGLAAANLVLDRGGGTPTQPAYCCWEGGFTNAVRKGLTVQDGIGNQFTGGIMVKKGNIENAQPTGTINGTNKVFTTTNTWNVNFFNLWVDGLLLPAAQYSVAGTTITIGTGPAPTVSILAQFCWN